MTNTNLFEAPIRSGQIRKNAFWYQYINGIIEINGEKFYYYSIKDAVKLWRSKNPIN